MGHIDDVEDAQEVSTSGIAPEPLLHRCTKKHHSTPQIDRQVRQLQLAFTKFTVSCNCNYSGSEASFLQSETQWRVGSFHAAEQHIQNHELWELYRLGE